MTAPFRFTVRLACAALALVWLCAAARAVSLRDYANRLREAQLALEALRQAESGDPEEEAARFMETIAYAGKQLPVKEKVETPHGPVEVNNEWLADDLRELAKLEPLSSDAEAKLGTIAARLAALRERAEELQRHAAKSGPLSKDEQKGKLENILRRPDFTAQQQPETAIQRLVRQIREFLLRLLSGLSSPLSNNRAQQASPLAQLIIYPLVALAVGLAVWRIVPLLRRSRAARQARTVKRREPRVVLGEKLAPDETAADLLRQADELARRGELRAAVRKGYIALLCALSERKAVRLEQHKTNRDYLRDVAGEAALYRPLQHLTNRFEYHWYGLAPANDKDWREFRAVCQETLK
jgi:polyhydroxyalkanoate synthesis regulator phasin